MNHDNQLGEKLAIAEPPHHALASSRATVRHFAFTGGGFAIIAVTFGLARYSYGLFMPEIGLEFGLTEETLGLIASASYLT